MSPLLSVIPAPRVAAVESALQQAFGTAEVTAIQQLTAGLSASSVYSIVVNDKPYVLKLDAPITNGQIGHGADRTIQDTDGTAQADVLTARPTNLQLAADAGVAPPLYYQNIVTGVSISGFINSKPLRANFSPDQLVVKLASTVRAIHGIRCESNGNDLLTIIDSLIGQFRQSRMLTGPIFDEWFGYFDVIRSRYPWNDPDKVFSHNDLNPNNILGDGERIWIIDWDTAFLNHRYIDLANTANYFVHTPQDEQLFLTTYFDGPPDDRQVARFFIMRQVCRIIYSMLMLQLAARHKPSDYQHDQQMEGCDMATFSVLRSTGQLSLASYEGQLMYGKVLINEALSQMRSPRFAAAIAGLG